MVIFQGFCEYIFKFFGSTSLFGAHSSAWLLPGRGKCTGQEHCVKLCAKEILEEKIGLLLYCYLFGKLFSFGVILHLVFFYNLMINGYMPLIEIFLFSQCTYYHFFYIKIRFSLTTTCDIPFLQIHKTMYFLLVLVTL